MPLLRIEPLIGFTPVIGRLVCMLTYARRTTLSAIAGLDQEALDHHHDGSSNSIGALLAHAIVVERVYQALTFEAREPSGAEYTGWKAALDLGETGRRVLKGRSPDWYVQEMADVRASTLASLATRDDVWLEQPLEAAPAMNAHWAWFHVAEDEINHRGQIRWLRSRLPAVN